MNIIQNNIHKPWNWNILSFRQDIITCTIVKNPSSFYVIEKNHVNMALQFLNRNEHILLAFTITVSGAIALPLVLNHLSHVDGLLHMSIHAGGFIIASFLTTMALLSWKRTKIPRMMFSSFAFGALAFA